MFFWSANITNQVDSRRKFLLKNSLLVLSLFFKIALLCVRDRSGIPRFFIGDIADSPTRRGTPTKISMLMSHFDQISQNKSNHDGTDFRNVEFMSFVAFKNND